MPLGEKKAKEEKEKRERVEDAWPLRCDTDDAVLLGGYGTLFVGGKVAGQGKQGKTGNSRRKESRKELFGASGNRINIASIGRFRAETRTKGGGGGGSLRTFGDNYRRADSISRCPLPLREEILAPVDQSFSLKPRQDLSSATLSHWWRLR